MRTIMPVCLLLVLFVAACGPAPYDKYLEAGPEETIFIVNMQNTDQDTNQFQFKSVDDIKNLRSIQAARIPIPLVKKSTGRSWMAYEWIDGIKGMSVKHTPVNREWTKDADRNSANDDRIPVESLDSVGFSVGGTIQARVEEANAATFLFYYHGKQLEEIIDTNIRGFIAQSLSAKFGSLPLDSKDGQRSCKSEKKHVAGEVLAEVREQFSLQGITVDYFGLIEGLEFEDPKIQQGITEQIKSSQDLVTAQNERKAQAERNLKEQEIADKEAYVKEKLAEGMANAAIKQATGEAEAAKLLLQDKDALEFEVTMYERRKNADARVEAAKNLPKSILPAGSPLLMGLDGSK